MTRELQVEQIDQIEIVWSPNESRQAEHAEPIELAKGTRSAEAFRLIGLSCLRHFVLNEPAVKRGEAEGLHQMRVGLRRLRAAIALFKDLLDDEESQTIKAQLCWLTEQLGQARDYDVFIEDSVAPLKASEQHAAELSKLELVLREARSQKLADAQAAVAGERGRQIVLQTALWLIGGDWVTGSDKRLRRLRKARTKQLARETLAARTKKLERKLKRFGQLGPVERHQLRIAVKKLHYGTEFLATLFPRRSAKRKRFVQALKRLQDLLGRLNDLRVHQGLARQVFERAATTAAGESGRDQAFAIGLVIGRENAAARGLLKQASRAGEKFARLPHFWS